MKLNFHNLELDSTYDEYLDYYHWYKPLFSSLGSTVNQSDKHSYFSSIHFGFSLILFEFTYPQFDIKVLGFYLQIN